MALSLNSSMGASLETYLAAVFRVGGKLLPLLAGLAVAYALSGFLGQGKGITLDSGPSVEAVDVDNSGENRQVIRARNILGLEVPQVPVESEAPATVSKSDPRSWRVIGVFVRKERPVVIAEAGGETLIVFQGEEVKGWTLAEVRTDGATWAKGEETRDLPLTGGTAKGGGREIPYPGDDSRRDRVSDDGPIENGGGSSTRVTMDRDTAAEYLGDPTKLLDQALYKPYKKDGEVVGFKISNIKKDSLLRKVGIRNNDVLLRINGTTVNDPGSLMEAYSALSNAETATIDIMRKNKPQSILIELE